MHPVFGDQPSRAPASLSCRWARQHARELRLVSSAQHADPSKLRSLPAGDPAYPIRARQEANRRGLRDSLVRFLDCLVIRRPAWPNSLVRVSTRRWPAAIRERSVQLSTRAPLLGPIEDVRPRRVHFRLWRPVNVRLMLGPAGVEQVGWLDIRSIIGYSYEHVTGVLEAAPRRRHDESLGQAR
jgi:hypothetical protein